MTTTEESKATVRAYFEAVSDGRPGDAWDLVADDAIWTIGGHSPLTGTKTKQQLIYHVETEVGSRLKAEGLHLEVGRMVAEGDKVACEFTSTAYRKRDGALYNNTYFYLFTVKNGKLWRCTEYLDIYHYVDVIVY
jgi:ketosteroid isomerase-like protein